MSYGGSNMIFFKTVLAFLLLLILARLLGKKQMSQMTFFHYVTGITIGSIAADIVITDNGSIIDEVIGLVLWCTLTALLSYGTLKSAKLRLLVDGQPTILIRNGVLQKKSLKSARLSIEELSMMLRERNIFSIQEVDYVILEPNGRLSVLRKQSNLNLTRADMDIPTSNPKYLPLQIIVDGKIIYKNLKSIGLSIEWLEKELEAQKINNISKVFYAEIQSDGSLYIAPC